MPHTPRIGIQIDHVDPFWVQLREVLWQRARALRAELVEVGVQESHLLSPDEQAEVVEDLTVQELDALICNTYPPSLLTRILARGIPIVYVGENALTHPRFTSRTGLYDAARMLGNLLHERLAGRGSLLVVGGWPAGEDTGQSRLDGLAAALDGGAYAVHHVPAGWSYEAARARAHTYLREHPDLRPDAIFGLSDSQALAARDACRVWNRCGDRTLVVGINGDPLALAAIADGSMAATVETDVDDIAAKALDLAHRAARGELLPPHFQHLQRLITADSVGDAAVRKMLSLATLPTRLIEVNRRNEQERVLQLETSRAVDRRVGLIQDEEQLSLAITELIRESYGFDHARFLIWQPESERLLEVGGAPDDAEAVDITGVPEGPLAYALRRNQAVVIPDMRASHRFAPDLRWPELRARVVVPVHLGGQVAGLLDLHRRRTAQHTREELGGLQLLADRLGISLRNVELYGQAVEARAAAEKADRLKTILLANVSHELRTPLHVILGYSRAAADELDGDDVRPDRLRRQLAQISGSGEHLLRLIDDLLDLSRAEVDELGLLPETIDTRGFLESVLADSAASFDEGGTVEWRLELPPDLPAIRADPVRLRQVLLNLLHNAHKFTGRGRITLGAEVAPPDLHLWVADTGDGIPAELQDQIFDPFVSVGGVRRREGAGLGLPIARRLVALHAGRMTLESALGRGSTFHVYLPLPTPEPAGARVGGDDRHALLLITDVEEPPAALCEIAERRGLVLRRLRPGDDPAGALVGAPALLAWDVATAGDDGRSVVELIRAQRHLDQIPVMLYQGAPDTSHAPYAAATGLLTKPLGDGALIDALHDLDPHGAEGCILVVEDDNETRALHHRIIAANFPGYVVREAGDGRAALEILARETPCLVVLDLVMPEIDGFVVLEAMRADRRTAAVPVLVLSGRALDADDIRRLGAARVIFQTKDVLSDAELGATLRRALERDDPLPPPTSALVKRALAFIQQHYADPISRTAIADAVGVNKDYLGRIFHQELGLAPWEYLIRYRVLRAKELLRTTDYSVAEVAARVGFDTATYFSTIFHREAGCSPRAYRAASG